MLRLPLSRIGRLAGSLLSLIVYWLKWIRYIYRKSLRLRAKKLIHWVVPITTIAGSSLWLAQQIQDGNPKRMYAILGSIPILALIVARIDIAVAMIVMMTCTIIYPSAIPRPFSSSGLGAGEMIVVFTLLLAFLKSYSSKRYMPSAMTAPLILFFLSLFLGLLVDYRAYLANPAGFYEFNHVYNIARPTFYYIFFFAVLYGIKNKTECRLVFHISMGLACLVSALVFIQYFVGTGTNLFFGTAEGHVLTTVGDEDVTRIQPPGCPLFMLMLPTALCLAGYYRGVAAKRYGIVAGILASGVVFTFGRNYWIVAIFSVVAIAVLAEGVVKLRVTKFLLVTFTCGFLITAGVAMTGPRGSAFWKTASERFESVVEIRKTYDTPSVRSRREENRQTWRLIKQYPIFGAGVSHDLRHYYTHVLTLHGYQYVAVNQEMIHNSYLEMWAHYGLLGLGSFAWLSIVFFLRCYRLWKHGDELWMRCMGLAFAVGYTGTLMRSLVVMTLVRMTAEIALIAFMWGMVEVANRLSTPMKPLLSAREGLLATAPPEMEASAVSTRA